jgi:hypothetical protein
MGVLVYWFWFSRTFSGFDEPTVVAHPMKGRDSGGNLCRVVKVCAGALVAGKAGTGSKVGDQPEREALLDFILKLSI